MDLIERAHAMPLVFNASGDSLTRAATGLSITAWSLLFWVRLDADTNNYATFVGLGDTSESYQLGTNNDGTTLMHYNASGVFQLLGALTLGTWYWLAMTCAGTGAGAVNVYKDSALVLTFSGTSLPTATTLWVGNNPNLEFLSGSLANLLVYSAVLPIDDIAAQRSQLLPRRLTNLNGWYPLLGSERDASVNGNHLTLAGTVPADAGGPPVPWAVDLPRPRPSRRLFMAG